MSPNKSRGSVAYLPYAALALSMALVGAYVALSKPLTAVFPVFLLAWLRFALAAVLLLPWLRQPEREQRAGPLPSGVRWLLFWESFFGNFLFSICMLYGVRWAGAVAAGVMMACIPAAVALLSFVLLREPLAKRTLGAIALCGAGMACLAVAQPKPDSVALGVAAGGEAAEYPALWGYGLLLAAVFCEAMYVVLGKRLTAFVSPKQISAYINLWGLALSTPLGLVMAWSFDFSAPSVAVWALFVFYTVAASVATVWLWMTGLQQVPAARAGAFTAMLPLSATAVGVWVLGEPLHYLQVMALILVLCGLFLALEKSA